MSGPEASGQYVWPSTEQRQAEREQKRDAVLQAAVKLFNRQGFHATSLDQVAVALNVTKPTIYHYFPSKDEILFECVRRGLEAISEAATLAQQDGGNGLDRLKSLMRRYALVMTQEFGMCVTRTADHELSEASRAEFRGLKRRIDSAVRAVVEEGMRDGSIAKGDPALTTFVVAGSLNWIARWYSDGRSSPPDEIASTFVSVLVAGLMPRPPAKTSID